MKKVLCVFVLSFFVLLGTCTTLLIAQVPKGREFGIGLMVGEPTGITLKYWIGKNALMASVGASYFGTPRIDIGYIFHFDTFGSRFVRTYINGSFALGIGEGKSPVFDWLPRRGGDESGLGVRGVYGVNVLLARIPLEFFLEGGVLHEIGGYRDSGLDAALGMRFYP